jgi:hypothetical protein
MLGRRPGGCDVHHCFDDFAGRSNEKGPDFSDPISTLWLENQVTQGYWLSRYDTCLIGSGSADCSTKPEARASCAIGSAAISAREGAVSWL